MDYGINVILRQNTWTGVCHELGWNKSYTDIKVGEHCIIPWPKYVLQFIVLLM